VLLRVLRGLANLLVVGGWLMVLALKDVIFLYFVLSEGLDSGGVPLLGLAKLLVVLLLSGNGFSTGNVISLVVQCLLFSQGVESIVRGVVRGASAAAMSLEKGSMSLPWGSSVSHVVAGVSSSSQVSHLLRVTLGVMSHSILRSASLVVKLLTVVVSGWGIVTLGVLEPLWVALLLVVGWCMSSHLTMMCWLPHLASSVVWLVHLALVMSNSVHSVQSLLVSWVGCSHSALHLLPLLGFHGLLLGLGVLLSLLLALVEHVTDLAKVVDLRVAGVELVVLVGALDHIVPSLLLSLSLLGLFTLVLALLGGSLFSLVGSIWLVACLLGGGLLILSLLWLLCGLIIIKLLISSIIYLFKNIDNDIGLRSIWLSKLSYLILGVTR